MRDPLSPSPQTPVGTPPLQNCEPIESKLRKQIQGCWRELLKECKEKDSDKQGNITAAEFLGPSDPPTGEPCLCPASFGGGEEPVEPVGVLLGGAYW